MAAYRQGLDLREVCKNKMIKKYLILILLFIITLAVLYNSIFKEENNQMTAPLEKAEKQVLQESKVSVPSKTGNQAEPLPISAFNPSREIIQEINNVQIALEEVRAQFTNKKDLFVASDLNRKELTRCILDKTCTPAEGKFYDAEKLPEHYQLNRSLELMNELIIEEKILSKDLDFDSLLESFQMENATSKILCLQLMFKADNQKTQKVLNKTMGEQVGIKFALLTQQWEQVARNKDNHDFRQDLLGQIVAKFSQDDFDTIIETLKIFNNHSWEQAAAEELAGSLCWIKNKKQHQANWKMILFYGKNLPLERVCY
jgi:hypothetical protein